MVLAAPQDDRHLHACLASIREHAPAGTTVVHVAQTAVAVNGALEDTAPADVVVLDRPCLLTPGWLERLSGCARGDTNTASASALADSGTLLALSEKRSSAEDLATVAARVAARTLALHPRLGRAVGPCVYVRRDAIELVGMLDERLDLRSALELDFAQRCVLAGLAHVAADDVLAAPLSSDDSGGGAPEIASELRERYPYLSCGASPLLPEASVLSRALEAVRNPQSRLWVTLDARALDGAIMGTQVHVLELIGALARTGELRLRLLVRARKIDAETLELLRGLPDTEVLATEDLDPSTPKSTVFHRPQQAFSSGDVALATALGERIVLSQLDLIAYRNPGYFEDARAWEDYRRASRHGLSASERVVVFSDHTRRELLSDALAEEARIRVVPPGLDHRATSAARRPTALKDPAADGFLLCLGTDFRHKNRVFALRLLAALRELHDWRGSLLLAGTHIQHGSSQELELAFLDEHPQLRASVLELGSVDEREKAWLLAHAGAVVYPSVYEGFGLVPFESALSGVPCLFAAQASLADAAPEGTATIEPWDPQSSAAAAYTLLSDSDARARHVEALASAARKLTWAAAATAMVEVYREAALAPVRDSVTLSRDALARERELVSAHSEVVERLIDERVHAQRVYDELNKEVGFGLSLIGPHGALPDNLQRALLALSARPAVSRPLYGVLAQAFRLARTLSRAARRLRGVS